MGFRRLCWLSSSVTVVRERLVCRRGRVRYTLVRPGRAVVRLVVGQDGAQMLLSEDQHAVQKLAAQGVKEPFAGRIGPRRQQHLVQMIGTDVCV